MKISSCLRMLHTKIDFKNQSSFLNWFSGFTDDSLSLKKNYSSLNLVNNNKQSLVVWGTNLSSQVGTGRFTKLVSSMIKLPDYYYSIVVGLLLSDGWLIISSKTSKNARLGFKQSIKNVPYVLFIFNQLSHYCSSFPNINKSKRVGKIYFELSFFTRSLPCFTELYNLFYINNVKVIPKNIYDLLSPVALAQWIQGDGWFKSQGVYLCTDSYSIKDVVLLMNVLIIRYNLKCTLHKSSNKTGYRIYISRKSLDELKKIVKPYFIHSMLYKLGD